MSSDLTEARFLGTFMMAEAAAIVELQVAYLVLRYVSGRRGEYETTIQVVSLGQLAALFLVAVILSLVDERIRKAGQEG